MNPLDAKTPRALFGDEAMRDARALKRAYARLVREHPPERDAAAFEHVRRLYEQGREQVEQAGARTTVRVAADDDRSVQQIIDDLEPLAWRDAVQALRTLARSGDSDALVTGYGIVSAVAPEEAVPWVIALLDVTGAESTIHSLVRGTMELFPGRARDPALEDLFDKLPTDVARQLRVARLNTLSSFHPERAAVYWRRDHEHITSDPDALAFVLTQVVPELRWELTPDALRHLLTLTDDARLPLDDDAVKFVEICLHAALAAAEMSQSSLEPVKRALRLGHRRTAPAAALALRDLGREVEDPADLFRQLDAQYPGVSAALYEMLELCTQTDAYLLRWAVLGSAPAPEDLDESVWLRDIKALATAAHDDPSVPELEPLILGLFESSLEVVGIVAAVLVGLPALVLGLALVPFVIYAGMQNGVALIQPVFFVVLVAAVVIYYIVDRARKKAHRRLMSKAGSWDLADDDRNVFRGQLLVESALARGYFVHEVTGAMERLHGEGAVRSIEAAIGSAPQTLAAFNDCHVRRAMGAPGDDPSDDREEAS